MYFLGLIIGGGTSQIQKNIISERGLGMPKNQKCNREHKMHFGLSDDQIFFQDNVKKFLEDNAPLDIIKKISDGDDSCIKTDLHKGMKSWYK